MRMFRWLELISGLITGVCGIGGVVYFLTVPLSTECSGGPDGTPICVSVSYLQSSHNPDVIWWAIILLAIFGGITLIAILDSLEVWAGLRWLWINTIVLALLTLLGIITIGPFLLPGLGLSILTSFLALIKRSPPQVPIRDGSP